jgi:single-strand DNA-binding protein|tara:strand:- start:9495 stop:9926 length:432 start_codon:yes stop_codon:yes gene_type:complete
MGNADTAITGNITADPELKYSNNGNARLAFSVASERRYQVNGEWTGDTSFFNVVAWRKTAEDAAGILEKGLPVIVKGRLEQRSWEDKETGQKRSTVEVVADSIAVNVYGLEDITRRQKSGDGSYSKTPAKASAAPSSDPFEDF